MTVSSNPTGVEIIWNEEKRRWETLDGKLYINNKNAYISLKDGRLFTISKWSLKE